MGIGIAIGAAAIAGIGGGILGSLLGKKAHHCHNQFQHHGNHPHRGPGGPFGPHHGPGGPFGHHGPRGPHHGFRGEMHRMGHGMFGRPCGGFGAGMSMQAGFSGGGAAFGFVGFNMF